MKKLLSMVLLATMCVAFFPAMVGSAAAATPSAEMLPDPSMEQVKTGWYSVESGWEYSTAEKRTGEKSITALNTSVFATPKYELDKSKIYDFSIYAKGTGRVYLYIKFYDADNNALANLANFGDGNYGFSMYNDTAANYADWKKLAFSFSSLGTLVPETAATFRIAVRSLDFSGQSGSCLFYYDDASLVSYTPGVSLNSNGNIIPNPTMGAQGDNWAYTNAETDYSEYHSAPASVKLKHDATATSGDATILSETSDSIYKLDLNTLYEYSVWIKTDNCTDVTVRLSGNDRNKQATLADYNVTNEWKQYKAYFKPSDLGLTNAASKFKVVLSSRKGGTTGNIWVDDLILRKADPEIAYNLLQDPTLAQSLGWDGYWRLQRGEFIKNDGYSHDGCVRMGFVKSDGSTVSETSVNLMGMKYDIAAASGKPNYAVLEEGKEYELTFWAKGTAGAKSVLNVMLGTADNEHAGGGIKIYPTTEWAQYKVLINTGKIIDYWLNKDSSATKYYYTPYFSIWSSDNFEGAVFIDDITLHEVEYGYADEFSYVDTSAAKLSVSGTSVTGEAYFNGAAGNVRYIAAVYNGGILKDCVVVDKVMVAGNNEITASLGNTVSTGDKVNLYVWNADSSMKPMKLNDSVTVQ